jgi:uncharacterized membrane protein YoaK (UPF0700 family)
MVDVIGFLSLGKLFTAHVTGNLVVIAALLVRGGPPNMAQILAVPHRRRRRSVVDRQSVRQARSGLGKAASLRVLLLTCVLIFSVIYDPAAHPYGLMAARRDDRARDQPPVRSCARRSRRFRRPMTGSNQHQQRC